MKRPSPVAALPVLLASLACTSVTSSDTEVTENFAGTVTLRSSVWHDFVVTASGTATVGLTSLASTAPSIGLGIGDATSGCERLTFSEEAQAGDTLAATVEPGEYCVLVTDNGRLTEPASYTVSVKHP